MPRIDAEHRGPLINIAAWFLLVTMILFTASKVVTKWRMVRRLQNDDFLLVLAMVRISLTVEGALRCWIIRLTSV